MDFRDHLQLNQVELRQAVIENVATEPTNPAPKKGQKIFNTTLNKEGTFNGTSWDYVGSGAIASVSATAPLASTGGNTPTISIVPASGSTAGSMSISDFVKLGNSTSTNTASTIVQRDSSGNFAAGTITANLTGTASNASQLNNQAGSYYLDRANHTGTQATSTIVGFDTQVRTNTLNQMAAPTSSLSLNSQRITSLADPVGGNDAANKNYVDAVAATGNNKGTARVVALSNINIASPGAVIDTVTLTNGVDLVLLAAQTTASENGLYLFNGASSPLTRATNADTTAEVRPGLFVFVSEGSANNQNTGYTLVTPAPITVGTTALTFTQTSGAGQITAGSGLTKSANTINVGAGTGITVNADDVAINTTVVPRKYSQSIGDGTSTAITVTHNLNNPNPVWDVSLVASPFTSVTPTVNHPTVNTTLFTFAVAPSVNQYRVLLVG